MTTAQSNIPIGVGAAMSNYTRRSRALTHAVRTGNRWEGMDELERRVMLSSVTVITHGLEAFTGTTIPAWVDAMAEGVASREGGADIYEIQITHDNFLQPIVSSFTKKETFVATNGNYVVELNWAAVADSLSVFGVEVTAQQIANLAVSAIMTKIIDGHLLTELPLHLIGHSRGASVVAQMASLLGSKGIWVDQVTFLDPHPVNLDSPVNITNNVIFSDNYYETTAGPGIPTGEPVNGSLENILYLPNGHSPVAAGDHADVHSWYYGTIDQTSEPYDGDIIVPSNEWYASQAIRQHEGFYYSSIAAGSRPSIAIGGQFDGTGYRDQITSAQKSGNTQWPDVGLLTLNSPNHLTLGQQLSLNFKYEDSQGPADVLFFFDNDQNPYDGTVHTTQDGAFYTNTAIAAPAPASANMTTSNLTAGGDYYVLAEIKDANYVRYAYLPQRIHIDPQIADNTPPIISGVNVITGTTTATISWKTNEASTTQVEYGTNPNTPYQPLYKTDYNLVTSHSMTLTGLSPLTTYYYRVWSVDASTNAAFQPSSGSYSFVTNAIPPLTDTSPPTPNTASWATAPYATGLNSIRMVATTATDPSGVQYYFESDTVGGHSSGWQISSEYEDVNLSPSTTYSYRVVTRDNSSNLNEGSWSTVLSATTSSTFVNHAPLISILTPTNSQYGDAVFGYRLSDEESDSCTITAQYSTDGGVTWHTATPGMGGDGTTGVISTSSPLYIGHTFNWNTIADLSNVNVSNVLLRLTATDPHGATGSGTSGSFAVNNTPTATVSIVSIPSPQSGDVAINYTVWSLATTCNIQVTCSIDGGTTWSTAFMEGGEGDGFNVSTNVQHTFIWSSDSNLGNTNSENVLVKITPVAFGLSGQSSISNVFSVNDVRFLGVNIFGSQQVNENTVTKYTATAYWSNNTTLDVTNSASWSANTLSSYATIGGGQLTALSIDADQQGQITATYNGYAASYSVTIRDVPKATPSFSNLNSLTTITYGTANITLSGTLAVGSSSVPGDELVTVSIQNISETTATSGNGEFSISFPTASLTVGTYPITFSYGGDLNLNGATANSTLTINKDTPSIMWNNPAAIIYGTPLSNIQLNATTSVAGGYSYALLNGTSLTTGILLPAGNQTIVVTFVPTDTTDFTSATTTANLIVNKATLTVTTAPEEKTYGQVNPTLNGTISGVVGSDSITASYSTSATQFSDPGNYAISVNLNDPNQRLLNYTVVNAGGTLTITKANQTITWNTPSPITSGTLLSGAQLDAAVTGIAGGSLPGSLTYSPANGALLGIGNQTLTVTAAATADYNQVTTNVTLTVLSTQKNTPTITVVPTVNPVPIGQPVIFTADVTSGNGMPTGFIQFQVAGNDLGGQVPLVNGTATSISTAFFSINPFTITANYTGDTNYNSTSTSISETVVPSSGSGPIATHLAFFQQPVSTTAGALPEIKVLVEGKKNVTSSSDNSTVTLWLNGLQLSTAQVVNGFATFDSLSINTAQKYKLLATDGNLKSATSKKFTISPDTSTSHLVPLTSLPTHALLFQPLAPIQIILEDQYHNLIKTNSRLQLSILSGSGIIAGKTVVKFKNGIATFTNLEIGQRGNYSLRLGLDPSTTLDFSVSVS